MRARRIVRPEAETRARLRLGFFADVVTVLWILSTSSSYCTDEVESVLTSPVAEGTSKNSVSPSLSWIVSHVVGEGLQVPPPWATTPETTMNPAVLTSLGTPR